MKFKQYLAILADPEGFIPTPQLRWAITTNTRNTAREEAIAAKILEDANPRENITGHFPWGPEQNMKLQQLWINPSCKMDQLHSQQKTFEWRDVPVQDAEKLYTVASTEHGDLPVPNSIREPGTVKGDFGDRLWEILGDDYKDD